MILHLLKALSDIIFSDSAFGYHFFKRLRYSSFIFRILKLVSRFRIKKRKTICIGNSMVSSAIWKKTCTSEFFKDDDQNCTSPKDECNLKSLKNSRVYVFSNCTRNHTITCY